MNRNATIARSEANFKKPAKAKGVEEILNLDDLSNVNSSDLEQMMDQLDQEGISESDINEDARVSYKSNF